MSIHPLKKVPKPMCIFSRCQLFHFPMEAITRLDILGQILLLLQNPAFLIPHSERQHHLILDTHTNHPAIHLITRFIRSDRWKKIGRGHFPVSW